MIHLDSQLFHEDDVASKDMEDETQKARLSHAIQSPQDIAIPNYAIFKAPSITFT